MQKEFEGSAGEYMKVIRRLISSQLFPLLFSNLLGVLLIIGLMYPGDWNKEAKFVNICFASVSIIIGIYNLGTETDDRRYVSFSLSCIMLGLLEIIGVLYLH